MNIRQLGRGRGATVATVLVLLVLAGAASGCCREFKPCPGQEPEPGFATAPKKTTADQDLYRGTPEMQAQIRELVTRIPTTTGAERIQLGRKIVSFGEPAVPILLESLRSPSADTRGTAAWLLGFLDDPRSAEALYRATQDCASLVRYEAAASLLRIGDDRGYRTLVSGLQDRDPRVRAKCILLLEEITGETFGYRVDLAPGERAAAVARWRSWVAQRRTTGR